MPTRPDPLAGKTVAVPETRDLESFAADLETLGARVIRCPLVGIVDTPNQAPVECWVRELAEGTFNDVIFLTGEGCRRVMDCARRIGVFDQAREALAKARKFTRGPKPARALVEIGLRPDVPSAVPTTAGVIEALRQFDLSGRHIGVQLYGENPNQPLIDFILDEGAHPEPVSPYVYAPATHDEAVRALIDDMAVGNVTVLAFTSAPQVRRLAEIADKYELRDKLAVGLDKTKVAAIGPVAAEELTAHNWRVDIMPQSSFIWKSLVKAIVEAVGEP